MCVCACASGLHGTLTRELSAGGTRCLRACGHHGNRRLVGTNREAGPECVCAGALPVLSFRSQYRAGICRDGSVFPDAEGGGEGFKMESEAHGGGAMRAADEDAGAVASAAGTAHGGQGVPGGAAGPNGPGMPAGPGDAVSREVPAGSGDMADPRGPSAAAESGGAAAAIPQIPGAPNAPGPGGDTAPGAGVLSNRVFQFLGIPFSSYAEADNARRILTRLTQLRWPVQRELYINGRMLVLRLTAEDHALLQMAVRFCLEQASLVMWILQNFVPHLFPQSQHRRGP
ncbi:cancer/testis antigen 1 [Bubalus bubalis]|uniref:cancer/testis antigen 1 n=1 Tax=Bubalus bubalis TaxID=89462 RepID=UPI001E1B8D18|nr:cancer/testis antigen 1 [Bubalus bubalis]